MTKDVLGESMLQQIGRLDTEHDVAGQSRVLVQQPTHDLVTHHLLVHGVGLDVLGVEQPALPVRRPTRRARRRCAVRWAQS